jgi:ubiquinone/menaquinone biosynthesis C-methylase UbiE
MGNDTSSGRQTSSSVEKNSSFFRDHITSYSKDVNTLDTYSAIRESVNDAVRGARRLLDIGNGGVFDYDTSLVGHIVALDLFLDQLPDSYVSPPNVTLKSGSALEIPEPPESFDCVLMVMLIHHLVGKNVAESFRNVELAISEAYRTLSPGGRLVIVESCVPRWFYAFERLVFPLAARAIETVLPHPATLQYPPSTLETLIRELTNAPVQTSAIPAGRWILQYGYKVPAVLTPARAHRFIVTKADVAPQVKS